jgi:hypothetical protein
MVAWGIEGIFTITVNNASSNDVVIEYMRRRLKDENSNILGGEFLHMRCVAHILNLVVTEGLKELNDAISNIRNLVRHVRFSPARMVRFKECVELERKFIQCKQMVCLDVPTRWNSAYLMISIAEKYQKAFD